MFTFDLDWRSQRESQSCHMPREIHSQSASLHLESWTPEEDTIPCLQARLVSPRRPFVPVTYCSNCWGLLRHYLRYRRHRFSRLDPMFNLEHFGIIVDPNVRPVVIWLQDLGRGPQALRLDPSFQLSTWIQASKYTSVK